MIITYFRSSSYNTWDFCNQQYYMEYVLGLPELSNKAADKGTIVHKVLENIAVKKLKRKKEICSDLCITKMVGRVYKKYSSALTHHHWTEKDFKDCKDWVWKLLEFNDGMFDPRKRDLVAAEPHFDFTIKQPWARYKYVVDGTTIEGYLSIKGTIDLVCKVDDDTYEVVDYKTGQRKNWATGEVKTFEKLQEDPQLLLYYYAVKLLYPEIENILVTIFYIRDGGPFTLCFDDSCVQKMEQMLKARFQVIQNTDRPRLNKSWKCTTLCHYGKNTFEDTDYEPIDNEDGFPCTQCEQIRREVYRHGIDNTTAKYTHKSHSVDSYNAPGEI